MDLSMKRTLKTLTLTIAILLGSMSVSYSQDFDRGVEALNRGDYSEAFRQWKPLAEQGYAKAQYNLGVMYDNGQGVAQDDKTAVKWFRKVIGCI